MFNRRSMTRDHVRHDRLLVSRFAVGDSFAGELEQARALVEGCAECGSLAADLRTLTGAIGTLPAAIRTRDFTVSEEQAERLRGTTVERLMRRLAGPGWTAVRPLAGAALAFGLVLGIVGGLPLSLAGGQPGADNQSALSQETNRLSSVEPVVGAPGPGALPPSTDAPNLPVQGYEDGQTGKGQPGLQEPATIDPLNDAYLQPARPADDAREAGAGDATPPLSSLMLIGGLALAVFGGGLLLLGWIARRRFADPLLR